MRNNNYIVKNETLCKNLRSMFYLFLFLFLIVTNRSNAQRATVSLDRDKIFLGEQTVLQLKLDDVETILKLKLNDAANNAQSVSSWFAVPDSGNHIEVIRREKIDTISINGYSTFIQKIVITSFDSGIWTIPIVPPIVKDRNNQLRAIAADSVTLQVIPVDVSKMKDFHPVGDIIHVKYTDYTWLYIAIGILILAAIVYFLVRWLKRNKQKPFGENVVIKGNPMNWALQQINLLEKENLIQKGEGKLFFTKLDDICRTYFDARTHTHTLQSTSIEMMEKLRAYLTEEKDRIALQQFTKLSNTVKFAKYQPQEMHGKEAIDIAKATIKNIENEVIEQEKKHV